MEEQTQSRAHKHGLISLNAHTLNTCSRTAFNTIPLDGVTTSLRYKT